MSSTINAKRLWPVPERPFSADPSTTSSSMRQSLSSFSSSISAVFGGRHSRSGSTSTQNTAARAPARPASTAPQQQVKWVPAAANQLRPSRHRTTSSASAAAAALSSSSPVTVLQDSRRRTSPSPPGEETNSVSMDSWKTKIQRDVFTKYRNRMMAWEHVFATGGNVSTAPSHRRDSLSSGSSASTGSYEVDTRAWADMRPRASREETLQKLQNEYEEELRTEIQKEAHKRGVSPIPFPPVLPLPMLVSQRSQRERWRGRGHDVLVEDEPPDEWMWIPEGRGQRQSPESHKENWKEMVRQEQQVIWDTLKRGSTPQQQQPTLSTSAGRKVHFAPAVPPSSDVLANQNVTPPSATPLLVSQTQPPSLPRTPHTPAVPAYPVRSISAHPSVATSSASRPISPAVTAPGVRPGSARPSSPAYARWIPSTGPHPSTMTGTPVHNPGGRTGSNPIAIPRRNSGTGEVSGSTGAERSGSMTGSWRDWSSSAHGHGYPSGIGKDAPTPSPTAANRVSHAFGYAHPYPYPRTASNSNLHSSASVYANAHMHGRTPSSGNLHSSHGRTPSIVASRRALTPGPVSSASGYARQRTASTTQRPPSIAPVLSNPPGEREVAYGNEHTIRRDKERARKGVVDDRDLDDESTSMNPVKRVQATAGLGSRTSSNRSALVDEDAPVPEGFSSSAPVLRSSSSWQSRSRSHNADEEEEVHIPKRDKGKGKACAPPSPLLSATSLSKKGRDGIGGLYVAQLEDFAIALRRELEISTEA